jgi:hypothetical protein
MTLTHPFRIALLLAASLAMTAQQGPPEHPFPPEPEHPEDLRLPNGKLQQDEILKAEYQKTLEDARSLAKMAGELKTDLEKGDYNVLSIATLKKTDEIDRLARRIHDRLRR